MAADAPDIAPVNYEYLEHPADIQLHAWGENFKSALQQLVMCMYGYMTLDLDKVERVYSMDFEATGQDFQSLVYNLLDECLYNFNAEPYFIGRCFEVIEFDEKKYLVKARAWGESFDLRKHAAGTEIKAITYSNMQVNHTDDKHCDIFVVVDI